MVECANTALVSVHFNVYATTVLGESIYLTGSVPELKNWDPSTAILMSPENYPIWSTTVKLPADRSIEYKYIRKNGSSVTWESDPNKTASAANSLASTTASTVNATTSKESGRPQATTDDANHHPLSAEDDDHDHGTPASMTTTVASTTPLIMD